MTEYEAGWVGTLSDVRVVSTGTNIAGPVAAGLLGDQGAQVIQVESAKTRDMLRSFGDTWSIEHRNQRAIALNIPTEEGREVMRRLLAKTDILIESSKGGTWDKWGFSDEALWDINPKLVIVHVSGFGQNGDPAYVNRGSFDPIGQAFSGYMSINGEADPQPPLTLKPYLCDYLTALFAAEGALAALYRAEQTGRGESVDVAQFEVMGRLQGGYLLSSWNNGTVPARCGNDGPHGEVSGVCPCADGRWIVVDTTGAASRESLKALIGLDHTPSSASEEIGEHADGTQGAEDFRQALLSFCASHSAQEAERLCLEANIPCMVLLEHRQMGEHPHFRARGTITSWRDPNTDKMIHGIGLVPRFTRHPGVITEGGPTYGAHNEEVLSGIGYSAEAVEALYEKGVIAR